MKIYTSLMPIKEKTSVALGYFDGIHLGHARVISAAAQCKKLGLAPVVLTFEQSPSTVITGKKQENLTQTDEKQRLIQNMGVEYLYSIDFSSVKDMSAEEFVEVVLHKALNAQQVFCGFNYHFGKNAAADSKKLEEICKNYGITVTTIEPVMVQGEVVSSTRIRKLLKNGDVKTANQLLAHKFGYCTKIIEGNHIGRTINAPTINQRPEENMILPRFGVYATAVTINQQTYCGVTNIGVKPTVGEYLPLCETWMPDYNGKSLYGETADVRLLDFLRDEKKFSSLDELKAAIYENANQAKRIFEERIKN